MQIYILLSVVMPRVEMLNVVVPISFIIVGVNEKVWKFLMALKSIDNKKLIYLKNIYFWTQHKGWTNKKIFKTTLFIILFFGLFNFLEVPSLTLFLYNTKMPI